ncbi:MAG: peptidoglycan-binding domain-containing protein [Polyangiales bacterium]
MPLRQITPPGIHVVSQGEDALSIAWAYGFKDWETVWNHSQNASIREAHPSPKILTPGAQLYVPENTSVRFDLSTNQGNRIVIDVPRTRLEIRLLLGAKPLANQKYVFSYVIDGVRCQLDDRRTDGDGWLREESLPMHLTAALVFFPNTLRMFRIAFRSLDPVGSADAPVVSGIQARLNNLGFRCGAVDGRFGPRTRSALRSFQRDILERDEPTGDVDDETLGRLESEHGS